VQLTRSDLSRPGIRRRRCGRGFRYIGPDNAQVKDPDVLARIRALVIPPAWEDVWICVDSRGHIQAVGTDAAGRRQYRYHDLWREQRDREKHDRVLEFGDALPRVADYLGNTPAVARASYIDPRVIKLYENGKTIAPMLGRLGQQQEFGELATQGAAERAVLSLLSGRSWACSLPTAVSFSGPLRHVGMQTTGT
jgi:DNA topoisomerase IB